MQSEKYYPRPSKPRVPLNYGGDGRYIYVLCPSTSPGKVCVIDSTLVNASNYLGGGAWTVNPEVAVITLTPGGCRAMVYIPTTKEVWIMGSDIPTKVIDANPTSPTFNTEVGTFGIPLVSTTGAALAWDAWNQTLIANGNQALNQVLDNRTVLAFSNSAGIESNRIGKFFNPNGLTAFCNEGVGVSFIDSNEIVNDYNIQKKNIINNIGGASGAVWTSEKYIYYALQGSIYVYTPQFVLLTTVSLAGTARASRPSFSEKHLRLIFGNIFANTISFLDEATLTNGGSVTKGYLGPSEDGTREFVCSNDIAIAIPGAFAAPTATLQHVHGIDMGSKSYIGYIPLTGLLGSHTFNNSYGVQNSCKNRIEV